MSNITVELFRISADSKYLDCIFECPRDLYFNFFELEVRHMNSENKFTSDWYDLSTALFSIGTREKKRWTIRIPLEKLGINYPAIYIGSLKTEYYGDTCIPENSSLTANSYVKNKFGFWKVSTTGLSPISNAVFNENASYTTHTITINGTTVVYPFEADSTHSYFVDEYRKVYSVLKTADKIACVECNYSPYGSETTMICSDVNKVYECILGDILNNCDPCKQLSDDTILKYLMLYGHVAAMTERKEDMAEEYYKQLITCFNICGGNCGCHGGMSRSNSERTCGCALCLNTTSSTSSSSCNCGR